MRNIIILFIRSNIIIAYHCLVSVAGNRLMTVLYSLLAMVFALTLKACVPVLTTVPATEIPQVNNNPQISQLIAPQVVYVSTAAEIICTAIDTDDDDLLYNWIAATGNITGSESSVTWIAPSIPGRYSVTVVVSDDRGGEVRQSVNIEVTSAANKPPEISQLIVIKMDKTQLIVLPGDTRPIITRPWNVITIECFAEDPEKSELIYEWTTPGGKIEGNGGTIKFVPIAREGIIVTMTVKDKKGAASVMEIHFYSDCCGHNYPPGAREY